MTWHIIVARYISHCFSNNKQMPKFPGYYIKKYFYYTAWKYFIGSYEFSVLLAQETHNEITRKELNKIFLKFMTWHVVVGRAILSIFCANNVSEITWKKWKKNLLIARPDNI